MPLLEFCWGQGKRKGPYVKVTKHCRFGQDEGPLPGSVTEQVSLCLS